MHKACTRRARKAEGKRGFGLGAGGGPPGAGAVLAMRAVERVGCGSAPNDGALRGIFDMTKIELVALALPVVVLAACQRPEPPPPPTPTQTAGELACAAQAAAAAGVDQGTVTVTPTTSTKSGATVYTVTAGDQQYTCVVEIDQTVSAFEVIVM